MKKFYSAIIVLAVVLAPMDSVHARSGGQSWLLGLDLSYIASKTETVINGNTGTGESGTTYYDLSLGYFLGSNFVVGGIYSTLNRKNPGATVSTSTSGNALGAMAGYVFDNGIHLTGSYFLSATDDEYKKGSGYEVDIGWRSFVSNSFFVGAKMAYRSIKYTELQGSPGFESQTHTTTLPYISLGFGF
ncbi:MAG: hypothetical protein JNL11_04485 [Bdellovibrionaceae bacterium]|nr:hypothetical protein [Pseudobdellovibrionaceae bacterium]